MRNGQVMVLTVLALGGAILSATTIAGLLMLYQIRQTSDFANSARAIFAADAGIEWGLYNFLCTDAENFPCPLSEFSALQNGTIVEIICLNESGDVVLCTDPTTRLIKSIGRLKTLMAWQSFSPSWRMILAISFLV